MPKPHTFPTLYDDLKTLSISFLSKNGYLKPYQSKSGIITWSSNGNKTGCISIKVKIQAESQYLEMNYKYKGALINYKVKLISAPSNLGIGVIWYFLCPHTGKLCRKLYLIKTHFYHRTAVKGCMYNCQTQSKMSRKLNKSFSIIFNSDKIYKKHFKTHYNGMPTKRYMKLMKKVKQETKNNG